MKPREKKKVIKDDSAISLIEQYRADIENKQARKRLRLNLLELYEDELQKIVAQIYRAKSNLKTLKLEMEID